eukprot:GSChrysophyteH1.ASY1.ANO1.889.1 assembled CDS
MAAKSYETRLFIDGEFVEAKNGGTFENLNPATAEKICDVSAADASDIDLAVKAARRCLYSDDWGYKSTGAQRAVVLRRLAEIVKERTPELMHLEMLDHGKPKREAEADFDDVCTMCEYYATLAEKQDKDQDEQIDPIGVVGAITPWNYPILMACWKVIPAISAGCTIVLKPSELAPMTCILLGQMCYDAGLPAAALSAHDMVDKLSFTGSVPTSQRIMAAAAAGPRALSLELGGKSPLIAFDDSNMDSLLDWILVGFALGTGQVCSATSRVLVHSSMKQRVLDGLVERMAKISIGDSLQEPNLSHSAKAAGIKCHYGGDKALVKHLGPGYFVPPTVFTDVPRDAAIWTTEIFGPVVCINTFETEEEAVNIANDSDYGLAGAVFSSDAARCTRVARALRVGTVWTNCSQPAFCQAPWGGVKKSGFGRELGRWGIEEFTSIKQISACAPEFSWALF